MLSFSILIYFFVLFRKIVFGHAILFFPYLDPSFFAHSPDVCLFHFPCRGKQKVSSIYDSPLFFITLFEKADSSVEKQGGDTLGSVNSCVMSECVKHTGGGLSRDFCKKCFVFEWILNTYGGFQPTQLKSCTADMICISSHTHRHT